MYRPAERLLSRTSPSSIPVCALLALNIEPFNLTWTNFRHMYQLMSSKKLSIGAVANLTGVPQHTLRKWESRHGIGIPDRTSTGRRVYSQDAVDQLRLIKSLLSKGHSLAHLTDRPVAELKEIEREHGVIEQKTIEFERVIIISEMGASEMRKVFGAETKISETSLDNLQGMLSVSGETTKELVVIEQISLGVKDAVKIIDALSPEVPTIICVKYLPKNAQKLFAQNNSILSEWPLTKESLARDVRLLDLSDPGSEVQERLFNNQTLKKLVSMNPSLDCECPNHIAKLVMDICAFEDYCKNCEDSDPVQRKTHADLGHLSGLARMKLEEALIEVARVDNIDLSTL